MNRSLTYALSAIAVLFVLFLFNQMQQSKYNLSSDRIFVNDSESIERIVINNRNEAINRKI